MEDLAQVRLTPLMQLSSGRPEVANAFNGGRVWVNRSDLWSTNVQDLEDEIRHNLIPCWPGGVQCEKSFGLDGKS